VDLNKIVILIRKQLAFANCFTHWELFVCNLEKETSHKKSYRERLQ